MSRKGNTLPLPNLKPHRLPAMPLPNSLVTRPRIAIKPQQITLGVRLLKPGVLLDQREHTREKLRHVGHHTQPPVVCQRLIYMVEESRIENPPGPKLGPQARIS